MTEDKEILNVIDVRRKKHDFYSLPQGFTLKMYGIGGYIYFREGDKILEIDVEWSGVHGYQFLTGREGFKNWVCPKKEELTEEDKRRIQKLYRNWIKENKYKTDF